MSRERFIHLFVSALFIVLVGALFYMQILKLGYYSKLSKNNSIRIIPIKGPRGNIFDRNGLPIVTNRLSFDVAVVYRELRDRGRLIEMLNEMLGISREELARSLRKASQKPYVPVTIVEGIEKEKAIALEEISSEMSSLVIETRPERYYVYGPSGSHICGYLGEISEEELERMEEYGYRPKDLIGRSGLEKYYDKYLAGIDGGTQIEVDNKGRQTRILGLKEPISGKDIGLTVDISLQKVCDELLADRNGAIAVMNPKTGEILALVSHPAYDPNVFVRPGESGERLRLLEDKKGKPLFNRATSGLYAPGSIFKIVTASSALDTGRITGSTHFSCGGSYSLGGAQFDCWKEGGHGSQEVTAALMNSCNVFFYNAGRAAGADNLELFAKTFGFGRVTGIDLPDEARGVVPGRLWKRFHRNDNWYEGDTLNYAIGQGYLLVTPMQVLKMTAAIANGGMGVRPFLVKQMAGLNQLGLKKSTIGEVSEGMLKVVDSENGTGKRAKVEGVKIAGKTGTAENPQGRTHAWFTGYAPFDDPRVCLVVFLEHGGKGGVGPSEIAKGIFEEAKRLGYLQ